MIPSPVGLGISMETSKQSTTKPKGTDKKTKNAESRGNASDAPFKALENTLYAAGIERTENS